MIYISTSTAFKHVCCVLWVSGFGVVSVRLVITSEDRDKVPVYISIFHFDAELNDESQSPSPTYNKYHSIYRYVSFPKVKSYRQIPR
jgi:hypothetical protein